MSRIKSSISRKIPHTELMALIKTYKDNMPASPELDTKEMANVRKCCSDKIIHSSLYIMVQISSTFKGTDIDRRELINEGTLGVYRAIMKYREDKTKEDGTPISFYTYCYWWVRSFIYKFVKDQVQEDTISLDYNNDENDNLQIPDKTTPADIMMELREEIDGIKKKVEKLPPDYSKIIKLRFGLEDEPAMTLEEVGQTVGLTRERIRQKVKYGMRKIGIEV